MCQFNLLIIDKKAKAENLKDLLLENGFGFQKIDNYSLQNQIGETKQFILTTKGDCDCGSIIGSNHQDVTPKIDVEKKRKKLKKKKWSAAKIERYLSDILKEQNRTITRAALKNEMEENNWIRVLQILSKQNVPFGILYRHFNGLIEDEKIEIEKINQISIAFLRKGKLRALKENQLNWITK